MGGGPDALDSDLLTGSRVGGVGLQGNGKRLTDAPRVLDYIAGPNTWTLATCKMVWSLVGISRSDHFPVYGRYEYDAECTTGVGGKCNHECGDGTLAGFGYGIDFKGPKLWKGWRLDSEDEYTQFADQCLNRWAHNGKKDTIDTVIATVVETAANSSKRRTLGRGSADRIGGSLVTDSERTHLRDLLALLKCAPKGREGFDAQVAVWREKRRIVDTPFLRIHAIISRIH